MTNETARTERRGESLVSRISTDLRRDIEAGKFAPGSRLPSENELTREYSVSRAVVREAIAILRAGGLVEARKGAGVFALEVNAKAQPFHNLDPDRVSSVIELLEIRTVFEVESAALAASRRSATQIEAILEAHNHIRECLIHGAPTRDADFALHLAIAEATQNRRFVEFLQLIRTGIIPRGELQGAEPGARPKDYNLNLQEEHGRIVDAIIEGDAESARVHMRTHLRGSLERYKALLRTKRSDETPQLAG
ncbi:FadR/GntR family transcriptional regulator [Rhizobium sp. 18065]|uniref:FadR/GntR family transcriptional regulator n=1 Tax=Rhizobium sp. 18065 TaxID=2681411 RepID=UPI00135C7575|nr:FadR/GntR family transcriptional regulator [Rhizobium sp. 18065]